MNFVSVTVASADGRVRLVHPGFSVEIAPGTELSRPLQDGAACFVGIRPEDVAVAGDKPGIAASVYATEPLGGETVVDLKLGDRIVKALAPPTLELARNADVGIVFDVRRLHVFDHAGDAAVSAAGADGVFRIETST
jgi:multiple sugar transport system ATP-binding protein